MTATLAIDPGTRALGWALFFDDRFHSGGVIRAKSLDVMLNRVAAHPWQSVDDLVTERPEIYPDSKANPNDILNVAIIVGACVSAVPHNQRILPRPKTWKGQVPKGVHHARIMSKLPDVSAERVRKIAATLPSTGGREDFLDAVGLGVWRVL